MKAEWKPSYESMERTYREMWECVSAEPEGLEVDIECSAPYQGYRHAVIIPWGIVDKLRADMVAKQKREQP